LCLPAIPKIFPGRSLSENIGFEKHISPVLILTTGGAAWDNARKYIESGNLGGKRLPDGSKNPTHAAAVVGETVSDPTKDTADPAINPRLSK
jgi:K(+)-stimulated pyrophosphate-energized sodium pump